MLRDERRPSVVSQALALRSCVLKVACTRSLSPNMAGPSEITWNELEVIKTEVKIEPDNDYFELEKKETDSDIDNESDYLLDSESDDASSTTSDEYKIGNTNNSGKYFYGKNGFKWNKTESKSSFANNRCNHSPGIRGKALEIEENPCAMNIWKLLFTEEMLVGIVQSTNEKLQRERQRLKNPKSDQRFYLADVDLCELRAFVGLLMYTSAFDSNHENIESLFSSDGTGREIFRFVMSKNRFSALLSHLRFPKPNDPERNPEHPLAAISFLFDTFNEQCQDVYNLGDHVTVDEMFISYRCKREYGMQMVHKRGIKIMCLADARNSYLFNSFIYYGKDAEEGFAVDEIKYSKPTQIVLRLCRPIYGTNRNITSTSSFSSIELVESLSNRNLTYVGTLKQCKKEVPVQFLSLKRRPLGTTIYGFHEKMTMVSYTQNKGKATILISSKHDRNQEQAGKPEIYSFYFNSKDGVNRLSQQFSNGSTTRNTRKCSMVIFFRILDICNYNCYILHKYFHSNDFITKRSIFTKQLAKQMVDEHMRKRRMNLLVNRELRIGISRILGEPDLFPHVSKEHDTLEKRKLCYLCPSRKKRNTKYLCHFCRRPICLKCTKKLCIPCASSS